MNKKLKARRTKGINGEPVITIEHIRGDDAEFSVDQLMSLAIGLLAIASDVSRDRLRNNQTREYDA